MMFLLQISPGVLAIALAACLTACDSDIDSGLPPALHAASQRQMAANDCRSPNAQTTQRGCRPATRMIATQ